MKLTASTHLEHLEAAMEQFKKEAWNETEISLAFSGALNQISHIVNKCNSMMLNAALSNNEIEAIRGELAAVRVKVRESSPVLEEVRSTSADFYRSALGDQKEAFEKLIESEQKKTHPQAYEALQRFHKITHLEELSQQISSELMDLSSEIEHQKLQQEITPPSGQYDLESNVPPASSLSP